MKRNHNFSLNTHNFYRNYFLFYFWDTLYDTFSINLYDNHFNLLKLQYFKNEPRLNAEFINFSQLSVLTHTGVLQFILYYTLHVHCVSFHKLHYLVLAFLVWLSPKNDVNNELPPESLARKKRCFSFSAKNIDLFLGLSRNTFCRFF